MRKILLFGLAIAGLFGAQARATTCNTSLAVVDGGSANQTITTTTNGGGDENYCYDSYPVAPTVSTTYTATKVLQASAAVLKGLSVTSTSASAFVMVFNATSAPADGAVTPAKCFQFNGPNTVAVSWGLAPLKLSTGATVVISTGADCLTKTTGVATAFFDAQVQ